MPTPKFCKSCQFWSPSFVRGKQFGVCSCPVVDGKIIVDQEQKFFEEGTAVHTDETFGCLYHSPVHGNLVTKIETNAFNQRPNE